MPNTDTNGGLSLEALLAAARDAQEEAAEAPVETSRAEAISRAFADLEASVSGGSSSRGQDTSTPITESAEPAAEPSAAVQEEALEAAEDAAPAFNLAAALGYEPRAIESVSVPVEEPEEKFNLAAALGYGPQVMREREEAEAAAAEAEAQAQAIRERFYRDAEQAARQGASTRDTQPIPPVSAERTVERSPERTVEQTPERPVEHTPERPVELAPEKPAEKRAEPASERATARSAAHPTVSFSRVKSSDESLKDEERAERTRDREVIAVREADKARDRSRSPEERYAAKAKAAQTSTGSDGSTIESYQPTRRDRSAQARAARPLRKSEVTEVAREIAEQAARTEYVEEAVKEKTKKVVTETAAESPKEAEKPSAKEEAAAAEPTASVEAAPEKAASEAPVAEATTEAASEAAAEKVGEEKPAEATQPSEEKAAPAAATSEPGPAAAAPESAAEEQPLPPVGEPVAVVDESGVSLKDAPAPVGEPVKDLGATQQVRSAQTETTVRADVQSKPLDFMSPGFASSITAEAPEPIQTPPILPPKMPTMPHKVPVRTTEEIIKTPQPPIKLGVITPEAVRHETTAKKKVQSAERKIVKRVRRFRTLGMLLIVLALAALSGAVFLFVVGSASANESIEATAMEICEQAGRTITYRYKAADANGTLCPTTEVATFSAGDVLEQSVITMNTPDFETAAHTLANFKKQFQDNSYVDGRVDESTVIFTLHLSNERIMKVTYTALLMKNTTGCEVII